MWNPFRQSAPPPLESAPKYPTVSKQSTCQKCGSESVRYSYVEQEDLILRTCRDCGARWYEAPLDRARL